MEIQLESLQEQIPVSGWTETYQNGANQKGIKKSTEGDVYNTLIKNYTTAIGALNRMLPSGGKDTDDLLEFIGGSK